MDEIKEAMKNFNTEDPTNVLNDPNLKTLPVTEEQKQEALEKFMQTPDPDSPSFFQWLGDTFFGPGIITAFD